MSRQDKIAGEIGPGRSTLRTGVVVALAAAVTAGIIGAVAATGRVTPRPGPDPDPTGTACETFVAVAERLHGAPTGLARSGQLSPALGRTWRNA